MSSIQKKRILYDHKLIKKANLELNGIYIKTNDDNIENVRALIIGPDETPYEKGFYFFDIFFPPNYPYSPPKVIFCTQSKNRDVRFNPNLYTNGKVCLSILGTWSGPGWTSCINLPQVLLSIQSLLNNNPLQNEPGFENEVGEKSINYNKLINYYNISVATLNIIEHIPKGFEEFGDIINKKFIENQKYYNTFIDNNIINDKKLFNSNIYSMSVIFNLTNIRNKIDIIKTRLKSINTNSDNTNSDNTNSDNTNSDNTNSDNTNSDNTNSDNTNSDKKSIVKTRKCPNDLAKLYEIGFTKISENNGKTYVVVDVKGTKNKHTKRWILYK
jgi:ubiquitin-conjugating enzyme E2 Z